MCLASPQLLLTRQGMHIGELKDSLDDILTCPLVDGTLVRSLLEAQLRALFTTGAFTDYPDGRLQLLIEAFNLAGDDRAALIAYILESFNPEQRTATLQCVTHRA